ncbi:MAG: CBS domain-containing protein [Candidatus Scatovivens sp.]
MCSSVIKVEPEEKLLQVAKLMKENDIGCVPVCDNKNKVLGFITDRDIITKCVANNGNCSEIKVSDVMETNVIKTTPDTDIEDASKTMEENQIRRLPVIEDGKIVGILSLGDLARHQDISAKEVGYTFECVCEDNCNCE